MQGGNEAGGSQEQERDINDVFCDILFSEERLMEDGYREGYEIGKKEENVEAFHLGYHRGAELGAEIGYYTSVADYCINHFKDSEKVSKEITALKDLLSTFPRCNEPDVDILHLIDQIRAKFKKSQICYLFDVRMPPMQSQLIIKYQIDSLLSFLEPLLNLANCHMVDYFTNSAYINLLPKDIQREIEDIGEKDVINSIFINDFHRAPHMKEFVENSSKFTLKSCEGICLTLDDFINTIRDWGCDDIERFKLEIFMTAKKSHEVEILSGVTAAVARMLDVTHLVDIGDGKGYLSSMLTLHHGIPVLGVDASNINTCSALRRVNKLSKVWNSVANAPKKSYPSKADNTNSANVHLYKQVTVFVHENFNLQKLIANVYLVEESLLRLGMVGLHTCGNLGPNSLKIFTKDSYIKFICNVGCCYHLITEKFEKNSDLENNDDVGFPMSQYLTNKKTMIGRSARMIANQSVDRILEAKQLPNITIYYRALFQVLLEQYYKILPTKHVGKFRKPPQNFVEYSRMAMQRVNVDISISDEQIEEINSLYESHINKLNIFYLLRCKLSPIIESLILLDRLLFLHEQGFNNSFLVQFFDPVVSPRCYGIVALKNSFVF